MKLFRAKNCRLAPLALCVFLASCAGRSDGGLTPVVETAPDASKVSLLVATTRKPSDLPGQLYSGERDFGLGYADVTISIPPDGNRTIGEVQTASSGAGDPAKDFVALDTQRIDEAIVLRRLHERLRKSNGQVLIFVHGFNTRFGEAVFRLEQIAHDSRLTAVPVLFTWPSRGQLLAYGYDRESANYSRDALERMLQSLQKDGEVKEIDLLAHSMGNMVALEALRQMTIRNGRMASKIRTVMLAAPDVDVDVFRRQIVDIGEDRPPFTLFASRGDEALNVSRRIWGDTARVGAIDPQQEPYKTWLHDQRINVIDLTDVASPDRLGHTTFAESPEIVQMIGRRLAEGQNFDDGKAGLGDKLAQVTSGAASTVGAAAGLAISAPIAIVDGRTRENLGSQVESLSDGARTIMGAAAH